MHLCRLKTVSKFTEYLVSVMQISIVTITIYLVDKNHQISLICRLKAIIKELIKES